MTRLLHHLLAFAAWLLRPFDWLCDRLLFIRFRSLAAKLVLFFLILGLLPPLVMGLLADRHNQEQILQGAESQLESRAQDAMAAIDRQLAGCSSELLAVAAGPALAGEGERLADVLDRQVQALQVFDLMLVADKDGRVIAANAHDAAGKALPGHALGGRSVAGEAWFAATAAVDPGSCYCGDAQRDPLAAESTGKDALRVLFATPVVDHDGKVLRLLAGFVSLKRTVSAIISDTRSTIAMDSDFQVIDHNGLVLDAYDPELIGKTNLAKAGLQAAIAATKGANGSDIERGERGAEQVIGYATSTGSGAYAGFNWAVLVRVDAHVMLKSAYDLRTYMLTIALVAGAVQVLATLLISRSIARPLVQAKEVFERVSQGDLTATISGGSGRDEIAHLSGACNTLVAELRRTMGSFGDNASQLAEAASQLMVLSTRMGGNAQETSSRSLSVSTSSVEIAQSVQETVKQVDTLGESVREISRNATEAAQVAVDAVSLATTASATIGKLGDASLQIGKVVQLVSDIAEQTNLLALNATIEAAHSGEAGRGFAVVANEIKELARGSSRAAQDIGRRIQELQSNCKAAIEAITAIASVIGRINALQQAIAAAVTQQAAATAEVSSTMSSVSNGSNHITETIHGVAAAAKGTSTSVGEAQATLTELARMSQELGQQVKRFRLQ